MRIVSMVPSWTETLLESGADVVGRTRYCIHPADRVGKIPVVGGTKDLEQERLTLANVELLILDREENPLSMALIQGPKILATHITKIADVSVALSEMARALKESAGVSAHLDSFAKRWSVVDAHKQLEPSSWQEVSGISEWLTHPPSAVPHSSHFVYVIWTNPWMAAGAGTFIASMLEKVGLNSRLLFSGDGKNKYPIFDWSELPADSVALFSSEPFPFAKKKSLLTGLNVASCIVDGESFSWFGVRSLRFLEAALGII